jgi:hypothetical protein
MFAIARTLTDSEGAEVKLALVYPADGGVIISKESPTTGEIFETMTLDKDEAAIVYDLLLMTYAAVMQRR